MYALESEKVLLFKLMNKGNKILWLVDGYRIFFICLHSQLMGSLFHCKPVSVFLDKLQGFFYVLSLCVQLAACLLCIAKITATAGSPFSSQGIQQHLATAVGSRGKIAQNSFSASFFVRQGFCFILWGPQEDGLGGAAVSAATSCLLDIGFCCGGNLQMELMPSRIR